MRVRAIPANTVNGCVALLQPFVPEVTAASLVSALTKFDRETVPAVLPMLTISEAARTLNTSTFTIRRWCKSGRLPGRKLGRQWRLPAVAVRELAQLNGGEES